MTAIQDNVKARITKKSYFFDLYCQSYEETITVDNTAEGIYNLYNDRFYGMKRTYCEYKCKGGRYSLKVEWLLSIKSTLQ